MTTSSTEKSPALGDPNDQSSATLKKTDVEVRWSLAKDAKERAMKRNIEAEIRLLHYKSQYQEAKAYLTRAEKDSWEADLEHSAAWKAYHQANPEANIYASMA